MLFNLSNKTDRIAKNTRTRSELREATAYI